MADTSIARVDLGATTLNRKWFMDVWNGSAWIGVFGTQDFKPSKTTTTQDTSDFASAWKGSQATALAWALEGKLKRGVTLDSALAYDPGQEILRAASDLTGVAARVKVRWYEMEPSGPRVEAYEGYGTVEWNDEGGAQDALSIVSFKVNGDGARTAITHPQPAVPYIASILPLGAAVGASVTITGTNLAGVTSGVFTAAAIAVLTVVSDTKIVVTVPGTSGAKQVALTSPAGTSPTFAYTVA